MLKIVFATSNKNKIKEIREIVNDKDFDIIPMSEAGINIDIEENGRTYEENALIKARAIAKLLPKEIIMDEDSGLEIDALDGKTGLLSARFLGHETSSIEKNKKILELMRQVEENNRTARFICSMVAVIPNGEELSTRGILEGKIGFEQKGENGFGYDPIFFLPDKNCYLSEISAEEKNEISHRSIALKKMICLLKKNKISYKIWC